MGVKAELLRCLVLVLLDESDKKNKKKKKGHQQLSVQELELGLDKWSENSITPDKKAAQIHL